MTWRVPCGGKLWEEQKGAKNKRAFKRLVAEGNVYGCLAFAGDEPVGWCCVGPRGDFPRLQRIKALRTAWDERTWSITCFFVRTGWRGCGVATALLDKAVAIACRRGARVLEGYPVAPWDKTKVPAAFAWTGIPALFEKNGFVNTTPSGNSRNIYTIGFAGRTPTTA